MPVSTTHSCVGDDWYIMLAGSDCVIWYAKQMIFHM